ncbi:hypothetical protein [Nostoc sp.]|uniref:hypothetical protein n=1 Tax=Nostoc sp. TaxID=1180 RepID=UPI002FF50A15
MQVLENNALLTEFSVEESAAINGGRSNSKKYLKYIQLAQTPASPGGTTVTTGELQDAWNLLIG